MLVWQIADGWGAHVLVYNDCIGAAVWLAHLAGLAAFTCRFKIHINVDAWANAKTNSQLYQDGIWCNASTDSALDPKTDLAHV